MEENPFMEKTELYIKLLGHFIETINKVKPKDRLEYAFAISQLLSGVLTSIKGWQQWMNDLEKINTLSMEDFKEIYPELKKTTIKFLEIDIDITKKKLKEAKSYYKKIKKKSKKSEKKETYVS